MVDFKKHLQEKHKRKIVENMTALYILNIASYVFPLIVIPYLLKVLGAENYGLYVFAYTILIYLTLLIRYGFDYSGTREIAIIREDKNKLNAVFSSIFSVQILITIATFLILGLCVLIIPKLHEHWYLYLCGTGILLGTAFSPSYLFQGLENMKLMTIVNFTTKLITTILIFVLVKTKTDFTLTLLIQSIGYLAGGILSLILVFSLCKIKLIIPSREMLIVQLKNGWSLFSSTMGMSFYRELNIIILGFMTNYSVVGLYAPAEKIAKVAQSFTGPIVNAVFPHISRRFESNENKKEFMSRFMKGGKFYGILLFFITITIFILAGFIIRTFIQVDSLSTIIDLRILSFIILFGGLNYYYGILGLVNLGKSRSFSKFVWIAGIVSLLSCFVLIKYMQDQGAAISMLLAEIILFVLIYHKINENK